MGEKLPLYQGKVNQQAIDGEHQYNREWLDEYNPFNSNKLYASVGRWDTIRRGQLISPPRTVSIDPLNLCDEKCVFCNADFVMDENKGSKLDQKTMYAIPEFLAGWNDGKYGVESVCIGGGGESMLNRYSGEMIQELVKRRIGVGVVTNGTQIDRWNNLEALSQATFVGVSINAGTRETYERVHQKDEFDHVLENVRELISYSNSNNTNLSHSGRGPGVSMKYLLHPYNVGEVVEATNLAKEVGFKNIHIRPVSRAWFFSEEESAPHIFTSEHIETFREQIQEAMKSHDDSFGVYGITHKFNPDFTPANDFKSCHAIFMNGIIMPPSGRNNTEGKFDWGECCDRRGDDLLTGIKDGIDLSQIREFWGSPQHWKMHDDIRVDACPRCTFSPHNKIYENVIAKNNMTYDFI